jgi:hypothetical protein
VNTFPSGHATIAATIAIGALLVAPDRLRWLVLPVVAVYAAVIAQAVQVAGWHRLSGTLGGVLLSVAVACTALAIMAASRRVQPSLARRIPRAVGIGLLAVSGAAVAGAAIVAALPILFPILDEPRGADSAFAHTALELVGVGVTVLMVTFFATLIDPYTLGAKVRTAPTPAEVPAEVPAASPSAAQPSPAGTPEG